MLDKVSETVNFYITRRATASKVKYLRLLDTYCVVPRYKILYTKSITPDMLSCGRALGALGAADCSPGP